MGPRVRLILVAALALASACSSRPDPVPEEAAPARAAGGAPLDAAYAFVTAINAPDPQRAAAMIDWETYVSEDQELRALVRLFRASHEIDPTDEVSRALMASSEPLAQLAALSRKAFETRAATDFAPGRRKHRASLLGWHQDRFSMQATILMPNGEVVEFHVGSGPEGHYRLVPTR